MSNIKETELSVIYIKKFSFHKKSVILMYKFQILMYKIYKSINPN